MSRAPTDGEPALERAYRATTYAARTPQAEVRIRIGARHPALDALCAAHDARDWAFVSAANPGSQRLSADDNARRHEALVADVSAAGWPHFEGEGRGDDGAWPAERSLLVLGIGREAALDLARRHDQRALVAGSVGAVAALVWCEVNGQRP